MMTLLKRSRQVSEFQTSVHFTPLKTQGLLSHCSICLVHIVNRGFWSDVLIVDSVTDLEAYVCPFGFVHAKLVVPVPIERICFTFNRPMYRTMVSCVAINFLLIRSLRGRPFLIVAPNSRFS